MRPHHWHVTASSNAMRTRNFIREIVDTIALPVDPPQPVIPLSLGDPAVYGNLPPPEGLADEVARVVREGKCNGYCNALGLPEARAAVARSLSFSHVVTPDDVAITCGCSHALLVAVAALCDQGSNLLVPAPAFPLYRTLCAFLSVEVRMYRLLPEQNWEADLKHVEQLCDDKTAAILGEEKGKGGRERERPLTRASQQPQQSVRLQLVQTPHPGHSGAVRAPPLAHHYRRGVRQHGVQRRGTLLSTTTEPCSAATGIPLLC